MTNPQPESAAAPRAQRARIERGRVMHVVLPDGLDGWKSFCTTPGPGGSARRPRARGPIAMWTTDRYWYPNCTHCPRPGTAHG